MAVFHPLINLLLLRSARGNRELWETRLACSKSTSASSTTKDARSHQWRSRMKGKCHRRTGLLPKLRRRRIPLERRQGRGSAQLQSVLTTTSRWTTNRTRRGLTKSQSTSESTLVCYKVEVARNKATWVPRIYHR